MYVWLYRYVNTDADSHTFMLTNTGISNVLIHAYMHKSITDETNILGRVDVIRIDPNATLSRPNESVTQVPAPWQPKQCMDRAEKAVVSA